jgi:hypothetical protein
MSLLLPLLLKPTFVGFRAQERRPTEHHYFTAVQNDASDGEVIAFWLSVSYFDEYHVPILSPSKWAARLELTIHLCLDPKFVSCGAGRLTLG